MTSDGPVTYTARKLPLPETVEQLRARIPGWGADLDPADRPSVPRLQPEDDLTGAHWELPDRQPELWPRERSIEHGMLTPVFGTSCPPKGLSGAMRTLAYRRWSEAQAAHWLMLIAADRVDVVESVLRSFATLHPDQPLTETGIRAEVPGHGLASRVGRGRTDRGHQALDPVLSAAPWVGGALLLLWGVRRVAGRG